jgi:hypothetical protein
MQVKSTLFGKWRVDEVVASCQACGSTDIAKARDANEAKAHQAHPAHKAQK